MLFFAVLLLGFEQWGTAHSVDYRCCSPFILMWINVAAHRSYSSNAALHTPLCARLSTRFDQVCTTQTSRSETRFLTICWTSKSRKVSTLSRLSRISFPGIYFHARRLPAHPPARLCTHTSAQAKEHLGAGIVPDHQYNERAPSSVARGTCARCSQASWTRVPLLSWEKPLDERAPHRPGIHSAHTHGYKAECLAHTCPFITHAPRTCTHCTRFHARPPTRPPAYPPARPPGSITFLREASS